MEVLLGLQAMNYLELQVIIKYKKVIAVIKLRTFGPRENHACHKTTFVIVCHVEGRGLLLYDISLDCPPSILDLGRNLLTIYK